MEIRNATTDPPTSRGPLGVLLAAALLLSTLPAAAEPGIRWQTLEVREGEETLEFELGYLAVAAGRGDEDEGEIDLAFVRVPSTAEEPGPPIVYLSGGPGQAAIPMVESPSGRAAVEALRALGDVVLLDQRGVGRSRPGTFCRWNRPPHPETFLGTEAAAEDLRQRFAGCVEELRQRGIDLSHYVTRESAHDLEDLRRALGVDELRLVGFSYGTHLALATLRYHPDAVDRAVLVGPEGPDHTWKLPETADVQLRKIGRLASADPDVGEEAGELDAVLARALRRLGKEPLVVTIDDPFGEDRVDVRVGPWGFRRILLWDLGDTADVPALPALVHQVARGETGLLEWFVAKRYRQIGFGIPAMAMAMDCASGVSAGRAALIRAQAEASLFGDVANDLYRILCPVLGDPDLGAAFRKPLVRDTPVLLVTGTLDANTPPFQAEEIRWGLPNARHLVVDGAGHEDLLGNPRVFEAILRFLGSGEIPAARLEAPPLDFFPLDVTRE